uniref:BAR domain-containing protein n=1 Tax=Amazona collaria TaxID=241587 RepID=A0A8B9GC76_9PSIT
MKKQFNRMRQLANQTVGRAEKTEVLSEDLLQVRPSASPMGTGWVPIASPVCPYRKMLRLCGEAEDKLAQELIHFELQVERDVIEPLFVLAEVSGGQRRPYVECCCAGSSHPHRPAGERLSWLWQHIWFLAH